MNFNSKFIKMVNNLFSNQETHIIGSNKLSKPFKVNRKKKWLENTSNDNSMSKINKELLLKGESHKNEENHNKQTNDPEDFHDTQVTDPGPHVLKKGLEDSPQKEKIDTNMEGLEQFNKIVPTEVSSMTEVAQTPKIGVVKGAQISQSTPVLTETVVTKARDELAVLGYRNPKSMDSSESSHEKPLVLPAPAYNTGTNGFTVVSYKQHHERKNGNTNKNETVRKAPYENNRGRGLTPRRITYKIINVYAPLSLSEKEMFFQSWTPQREASLVCIIAGDFNTNIQPEHNRISQAVPQNDSTRKMLIEKTAETRNNSSMAICIDYIFIDKDNRHLISEVNTRHGNSDHLLVECTLQSRKNRKHATQWRFEEHCFKNSLLEKEVLDKIRCEKAGKN
ncbi:9196_t:CDS:2 [Gigaspora rosea]|nr:9196_t:CDS:2 [Gigaspora rosea]